MITKLPAKNTQGSKLPALNRISNSKSVNVEQFRDKSINTPGLSSALSCQPILGPAAHIRPHISAFPASAPPTDILFRQLISLPSVIAMPKRQPYAKRAPLPKPQLKKETMLTIPQARLLLARVNRDYQKELSRDIYHYKRKPNEQVNSELL